MKLKMLHEGHWRPISGYPGSMVKKKKLKGKARKREMSFIVHPETAERFKRWGHKSPTRKSG